MTASVFSLGFRLEIFAVTDLDVRNNTEFSVERLVSYNNGETWINNWVKNNVGVFSSSVAACITGDSLDTFLVGRGQDNRFWFTRLQEYYEFSTYGFGPIGAGVFKGKPAICSNGCSKTNWKLGEINQETTYSGVRVMVFGRGNDNRIWWAYSNSGGNQWDMAWSAIGNGVFTSSPAACCSADGKLLAVFGKGNDNKIWWAYSTNAAAQWQMAWSPIGNGVFTSSPAACCSADGKRIYVFCRGNDNRIWWAYSTEGVSKWAMAWSPIGEGVFLTMPSANCSWDGKVIHVFAKGNDNRIWQARSINYGRTWNIAWRKVHDKIFVDIDL